MLTPIILLVLMTAPYLISRVLKAVMQRDVDLQAAGAIHRNRFPSLRCRRAGLYV